MREVFENWDGKTTSDLRDVVDAFHADLINDLLDACRSDDEVTARAASWVFKALLERGVDLPFPADLLVGEVHWEVALHLLQSFQFTTADCPPEVVEKYLTHQRPMLRAWGLDAYARLGGEDLDLQSKIALSDDAASVRARARQITKWR